ncbi:MAG: type II toxin-antitoxin system Phd/YefM family antitoxin [Anaerolineae bacterium]|nr:type II toxin-antitoxin system Phd/YefM family antitoxin [Anaerolineae bacterium]
MAHQVVINASEGHRKFGQLLKRVYGSDEHLIVERDGFPVAVLMSYQEYEQLSQSRGEMVSPENLPSTMSLAEAFGSVTPIHRPEDFATLHEAAIEDHVQQVMDKEKE